MPFTATHVAAVLPLARAPLVASALVIGSMAPDLPHFLPVLVGAAVTHSPGGVVSVDVALGLGVFLVWHGILSRPALASAPAALRGRVGAQATPGLRTRMSSPRRVLMVLVSLSVGAATHVVWDAFTHAGRWGTTLVPWLAREHGLFAGYTWAQYGSGVFGGLVVTLWLARWWRSTSSVPSAPGLRPEVAAGAWLSVLLAGAAGAAAGSVGPLTSPGGPDLRAAFFSAVTLGPAVAGAAALLLAVIWHLLVGSGRPPTVGQAKDKNA